MAALHSSTRDRHHARIILKIQGGLLTPRGLLAPPYLYFQNRLRQRYDVRNTRPFTPRLELVQHSAAKVVLRIRRGDRRSVTAALKQPHWLPVKWRVEYKLLVLVFRTLLDRTSTYLASLLTPHVPRPSRPADHNRERYGRRSFSRAGPTGFTPSSLTVESLLPLMELSLLQYYVRSQSLSRGGGGVTIIYMIRMSRVPHMFRTPPVRTVVTKGASGCSPVFTSSRARPVTPPPCSRS